MAQRSDRRNHVFLNAFPRALAAVALLCCPPDFRTEYCEELTQALDAPDRGTDALDIILTGLSMRFESLTHDLRNAVRALVRVPTVTLIAIVAIALGVGANFFVAALVQGFFLRPLPFHVAEPLYFVQETNQGRAIPYQDARLLAKQISPYADLSYASSERSTLVGSSQPELLDGARVSRNYFALLNVEPFLGRFFTAAPADHGDVVVSYEYWREHGANAASTIGRPLQLGNRSYRIVGVAPSGFHDPTPYGYVNHSYWVLTDRADPRDANGVNFNAIARVHPGVNNAAFVRDLRAQLAALAARHPQATAAQWRVGVSPMASQLSGDMGPLALLLYAFVTIVLVIALVNVANLNIARTATRAGDLSLRAALGASPMRTFVQLTMEAFLQSIAGCFVGIIAAFMGLHYLSAVAAPYLPQMADLGLDGNLIAYMCALVVVATMATGTLPALTGRSRKLYRALNAVGRSEHSAGSQRGLTRLVILEISLATALVIGAGLILHGVMAMVQTPLAFDPQQVYVASIRLPNDGSIGESDVRTYVNDVIQTLQPIVGASNVSASLEIPLTCCSMTAVRVGSGSQPSPTLYNAVSTNYFATLRIPLVIGRSFTDADRRNGPCVAVVDEMFANRYFGTDGVIGRIIQPFLFDQMRDCAIVGVVKNVPQSYGKAPNPMLYVPMAQVMHFAHFVVRSTFDPSSVNRGILLAATRANRKIPTPTIVTYRALMFQDLAAPLIIGMVFTALAIVALSLALSGIYALVSYAVARRVRDFGVRMAVGATFYDILGLVLKNALFNTVLGLTIGVSLALLLALPAREMLFDTSIWEPSVYAIVILVVTLSSLLSALAPAMRAALIRPSEALRHE